MDQNFKFEREDWTLFRTVEGLQQKAGVPAKLLRRLALKELTDNALDTGAKVRVGELPGGGYFVEDDGPGIDGKPEDIARLFSIARPLVSTKLERLPTRGALGNGLRVVAGTVLASEGTLTVVTRKKRIRLAPQRDGTTIVTGTTPSKRSSGTRIEITFGPDLPEDSLALIWANWAFRMQRGTFYSGRSSPFWYDVPQFHELLSASGSRPVRDLIANLDGCTGARAGHIIAEADLGRAVCSDLTREQASDLLTAARYYARPVNPNRLGSIGPDIFPEYAYAKATGTVEHGTDETAEIPFVVETWVRSTGDDETSLVVCVNRTPVAGEIYAARDKGDIDFHGCGLANRITKAPREKQFVIWLNITTPHMPITSDGKNPDLEPFLDEISEAVGKAVRKAQRLSPRSAKGRSQKDIVLENLDDVIAEVSGDGIYRFNARQLFYALRPIVMQEIGEELKIGNFTSIITEYESDNKKEIEGMYREPRGSITHPHSGETITLGTLMVEDYERPLWTFNKIVYIEKEGANEALKEVGWLERHDCAVMSSKGFSTRAAKDLIDKLAEHDEPVQVFCVHDADASGTMIYQTLQEETKARQARKIEIINLGLEPWEAIAMGLEVENLELNISKKTGQPIIKAVADYVTEHDDGEDWPTWLQTHRVELNAMTTPRFIKWLDAKMAEHGNGKLIPPDDVIEAELEAELEGNLRESITEEILREADLEGQIAEALDAIEKPAAAKLIEGIKKMFKSKPERAWRDHIKTVATELETERKE